MTARPGTIAALLFFLLTGAAHAGTSYTLADIDIEHSDERRNRGAVIVMDICLSCHDVRYLKFRDLVGLGFPEAALLQKHIDQDLAAPLLSAMSPGDRVAMFGRLPPDLSLIAGARDGGARYIYTLFTSYRSLATGEVVNSLRPEIKMPDIFGFASVSDTTARAKLEQRIHDVAVFLHWVSYPHEAERRQLGYYVIGYLVGLTLLFYLIKRRVWRSLAG